MPAICFIGGRRGRGGEHRAMGFRGRKVGLYFPQSGHSEPAVVSELQERDWRRLVETIHRGNCVLVLGADVVFDPVDVDRTPLSESLARHLADMLPEPPGEPIELPLVAELYLQQPDRDRYDLEIEVTDFYQAYGARTTDFHRDMAAMPFNLCITTTPDRFLEKALVDTGKEPIAASYDFSRPGRPAKLGSADERHPIVYSLFGDLTQPSSLVLTETELLDFLVTVVRGGSGLPDYIAGQLASPQTGFLFVGFGFQRWYSRILLHALQSEGRRTRSLAMEGNAFFSHPEHALTALYFEQACSIVFRRQVWTEFAADLRRRYQQTYTAAAATAVPPPGAPKVFLCHDSRDRESVAALEGRLHGLGVDTWRDKQDLRGGDDWDRQIKHVLRKQVDYVLVCESPRLVSKGEGYLHLEIKEALARQQRFPGGRRFLIPVMIEPCTVLADLEALHREDLTGQAGVERLAEALLADWREHRAAGRQP